MKINPSKYKLSKKSFTYLIAISAGLLVIALGVLVQLYRMQLENDKAQASAKGEGIVAQILTELRRCYDTTELMNDLYQVNGEYFLNDFAALCAELQDDNLAIGSMYWAPEGVIRYSYPYQVSTNTQNFEMLKDPIQGPKANLAINTRKATIAGPHKLIEGGKGFIIRNPHFDNDGNFIAFAIMVVDTRQFCQQILDHLTEEEKNYRFAVWKEEDPTAELDEGGYIFSSDGPIEKREIVIKLDAPNDIWYLTLEPKTGWTPLSNMVDTILIVIGILLFLTILLYGILYNYQMMKEMEKATEQQLRMQETIRHQKELEQARDAAEAANRSKTIFLNNMSHDIRTPMNAILGFTQLMEKQKDNPDLIGNYLGKIKDSGEYLLSIINNVLDIARIDSGHIELDREFYDLRNGIPSALAMFEDTIKQKHLDVSAECNVDHPYIFIDKTKINQIVINLLSNAIKYTPEGGTIKMSYYEVPSERPDYMTMVTKFSDNGIGMSQEFQEHIFDYFSREHNTTESKIVGSGLGMSIVKKLIDFMGGTITVESEIGKGTTFTVTMSHPIVSDPEQYLQKEHNPEQNIQKFNGKRILLTEDNELNAEIATAILEEVGIEVERAEDGVKCVKKFSDAPAGYFDAILMDIQMPNLNGYDTTRRIRQLPDRHKAQIPILAMTANAFEEDKQLALAAGMNGHLAKPISVPDLMAELSKLLK